MQTLRDADIVRLWDIAGDQHTLDWALSCLEAALPECTRAQLARLSLGQRDRLLFGVREAEFGPQMACEVACPSCGEELELLLSTHELRGERPEPGANEWELTFADVRIVYRLPTSHDVGAALRHATPEAARAALLASCVVQVEYAGQSLAPEQLPPKLEAAVVEAMAAQDPCAEVLLDLACGVCGEQWRAQLDIVAFVRTELSVLAQRILDDVHRLARGYCWSEEQVLGLSARKRNYYLDRLVG